MPSRDEVEKERLVPPARRRKERACGGVAGWCRVCGESGPVCAHCLGVEQIDRVVLGLVIAPPGASLSYTAAIADKAQAVIRPLLVFVLATASAVYFSERQAKRYESVGSMLR